MSRDNGGQFHQGQMSNPPHPQDVPGITRRDWLAGLAMQGMISDIAEDGRETRHFKAIPKLAYIMADDMIAESNK